MKGKNVELLSQTCGKCKECIGKTNLREHDYRKSREHCLLTISATSQICAKLPSLGFYFLPGFLTKAALPLPWYTEAHH